MMAFIGRSNAQAPTQPPLKVELISEQATSAPGQPLWVGLSFRLEQGWQIYWQNPGDSGEPPKVQWDLPAGLVAGSIRWPQPIRLGGGSVVDYGYEGLVLLMAPVQGSSNHAATPLPSLAADVKYIVCREVCIPGKAHLTLAGPAGGAGLLGARFSGKQGCSFLNLHLPVGEWPQYRPSRISYCRCKRGRN